MSAHDFWNDRYAGDTFLYGTEPNGFLVEQHTVLRGPVLSIAEGDAKAHRLAEARGVSIRTECTDLATWTPPAASFGAVVSIFAHLPRAVRARLYPLLEAALAPGGVLVFEAYHARQLAR
nr:class I SAM-dependent methyltransferase [Gemmatimonadaceae bacterium]